MSFQTKLDALRRKRDNLLYATDYLGLSDRTMSSAMQTYRQNLRDITDGVTTEAEVDAVVFPTKPSE